MNKNEIINLIRNEAKKQHKTFKNIATYAGMKSNYINKFLGGGCGLPSIEKLKKIEEFLNIKIPIETLDSLKSEIDILKKENTSLKNALKKYENLQFIYENFEELEKMKSFLNDNKKIIEVLKKW